MADKETEPHEPDEDVEAEEVQHTHCATDLEEEDVKELNTVVDNDDDHTQPERFLEESTKKPGSNTEATDVLVQTDNPKLIDLDKGDCENDRTTNILHCDAHPRLKADTSDIDGPPQEILKDESEPTSDSTAEDAAETPVQDDEISLESGLENSKPLQQESSVLEEPIPNRDVETIGPAPHAELAPVSHVPVTLEDNKRRNIWIVIALVAVVAALLLQILQPESPAQKNDVQPLDIFRLEMEKVKIQFPSQREELWKRSRIHLQRHFLMSQPTEPVSIILTAGVRAEGTLRCLAQNLASALSAALNASALHLEGASKSSQDSDLVKADIDSQLQKAFEGGKPIAVIHRFEELPPASTLIFYRYCDHENAAFKKTFLIFTVLLGEEEEIPSKIRLSEVEEMQSCAAPRSNLSGDEEQERRTQESVLSQLLGDYDKVKAISEGSDCGCKCVVRPLSRSACRRIEEGQARLEDFYTVETITSGPECKCACIAPPSAVNPCEGEHRLKKLAQAAGQNAKLSTILDLLEGSLYGLDLLKLHSVTNKLLERMDHIEKVVVNNSDQEAQPQESPPLQADIMDSAPTPSVYERQNKKSMHKRVIDDKTEFVEESPSVVHTAVDAEVIERNSQETPKRKVTQTGPKGLIIRGMTFYKSDSDPMVADDGEPGENLFEYDSFSGDGPINLFIEENLLQHKTPRSRTRPGQRTFKTESQFGRNRGNMMESTAPPLEDQPSTTSPRTAPTMAPNLESTPAPSTQTSKDEISQTVSTQPLTPLTPRHTPPHSTAPGTTTSSARTVTTTLLSSAAAKTAPGETRKNSQVHIRKPADCKDTLATISEPVSHNTYGKSEGAWMKDSKSDNDKIYVTNYFYGDNLLEFSSLEVFKQGHFTNSYKLPYNWIGTGHVVYRGAFYYNRAFSRDIIKFDLSHRFVSAWTMLHDAALEESSSPWEWSSYSDINIAVDESGLWVVYPALDDEGFLHEVVVLSRLNHADLSMQKETTWRTGLRRNQYGNCFIVCGVLYFVDSYNRKEANLEYAFDTHTNTQMIPRMPFTNKYTYTTQVEYNPKEGVLYAWDNGHQVTYNVTFAYFEP
uniref:Olfactomedin-like domain-containing protein n=1 Tax=Knipowitschia caucasica TaxID=637954 RepID=A0AAV2KUR3_KNICA